MCSSDLAAERRRPCLRLAGHSPAFAREHMGALLQACDGTRTLDEIGEVTGVGPQAAFEAVSLLWTGGIVEDCLFSSAQTSCMAGSSVPLMKRSTALRVGKFRMRFRRSRQLCCGFSAGGAMSKVLALRRLPSWRRL